LVGNSTGQALGRCTVWIEQVLAKDQGLRAWEAARDARTLTPSIVPVPDGVRQLTGLTAARPAPGQGGTQFQHRLSVNPASVMVLL